MSEQGRGKERSLIEAITRLVLDVIQVVEDVQDLTEQWRKEKGENKDRGGKD